ncbi:hypothetical protein HDU76_010560, partial [Blyttiomyces sp. JEL0837]
MSSTTPPSPTKSTVTLLNDTDNDNNPPPQDQDHEGGGPSRTTSVTRLEKKPQFTPYVKPSKMAAQKAVEREAALVVPEGSTIVVQFESPDGDITGPPLLLPAGSTP